MTIDSTGFERIRTKAKKNMGLEANFLSAIWSMVQKVLGQDSPKQPFFEKIAGSFTGTLSSVSGRHKSDQIDVIFDAMSLMYPPCGNLEESSERLTQFIEEVLGSSAGRMISSIVIVFDASTPINKNAGALERNVSVVPEPTPTPKSGETGEDAWDAYFSSQDKFMRTNREGKARNVTALGASPQRMKNRFFKQFLVSRMIDHSKTHLSGLKLDQHLTVCIRAHGAKNTAQFRTNNDFVLFPDDGALIADGYYMEAEGAIPHLLQNLVRADASKKIAMVLSNDGDSFGPVMLARHACSESRHIYWATKTALVDAERLYHDLKTVASRCGFQRIGITFPLSVYAAVILVGGNDYYKGLRGITTAGFLKKVDPKKLEELVSFEKAVDGTDIMRLNRRALDLLILSLNLPDGQAGALDTAHIVIDWYLRYISAGFYCAKEIFPPQPNILHEDETLIRKRKTPEEKPPKRRRKQ